MAKSSNKRETTSVNIKIDHPLASRKTLKTLTKVKGEIVSIDGEINGIRTVDGNELFCAVNLPAIFSKPQKKILFSGMVKEMELTELWAAQPILLKSIEALKED